MGPTKAYIFHKNLKHNISLIRNHVGSERRIMAVVKADAYGHGIVEIARTCIESGCEYLAVAFAEEGILLRNSGISAPILVFGAQLPDLLSPAIENELELTVTTFEQIEFLKTVRSGKPVKVHVKFNTGMNRVGFDVVDAESVLSRLGECDSVTISGVYSHFATSDEKDKFFAKRQLEQFLKIKESVSERIDGNPLFHMANSGAIMTMPDALLDMVRPGIMLYGHAPSPDFELEWELREVMSLRSRLTLIRSVTKNEPLSYGRRYYTKSETDIGVIPVGYADGFSRGLTNNTDVIINDNRYPQRGTVCMDMIMVELGTNHPCKTGDEVILFGGNNRHFISINEIAEKLNTIAYEVTCNVSSRVPRVHIYD